jgi:hydrogenase maturation protease
VIRASGSTCSKNVGGRQQWGLLADQGFESYLRRVVAAATTRNGVCGIKLYYYQLAGLCGNLASSSAPPPSVAPSLLGAAFPGVRYLWLRGRDKARQALSYARASQTQVRWQIGGASPPRTGVVGYFRYDPADGEPAAVIEAWSGRDLAVIVGAVRCEPSTPWRIWRSTDADLGGGAAAVSSHALGFPDALRLGQVLGRVPGHLVVFAVEADRLDLGAGLSPEVSAALPRVVRTVLGELACPA